MGPKKRRHMIVPPRTTPAGLQKGRMQHRTDWAYTTKHPCNTSTDASYLFNIYVSMYPRKDIDPAIVKDHTIQKTNLQIKVKDHHTTLKKFKHLKAVPERKRTSRIPFHIFLELNCEWVYLAERGVGAPPYPARPPRSQAGRPRVPHRGPKVPGGRLRPST